MKLNLPISLLPISLVFLFFFINVDLTGQGLLTGKITDVNSGQPIAGAKIQLQTPQVSVSANSDELGVFVIPNPKSPAILKISARKYISQKITISPNEVLAISLIRKSVDKEIENSKTKNAKTEKTIAKVDSMQIGFGNLITSAVSGSIVKVEEDNFNKGIITDPALLVQGKFAGVQIYNRGGDPNGISDMRIRGLTSISGGQKPLVVIDGVTNAALENVDPSDIETITILKDASAAAIYGIRALGGVLLVTTKNGKQAEGAFNFSLSSRLGVSMSYPGIQNMNAMEFIQAGGVNLNSSTDWVKEVSRSGWSNVSGLALSGKFGTSSYRLSANTRDVDGVLKNTGFERLNTRLNFSTSTPNDKLNVDVNASFTNDNKNLGFQEAFRYALTYNPTAPVFLNDEQFNGNQFEGYYQTLGLFDSYNPLAIIEINQNNAKKRNLNFDALIGYNILQNLTASIRFAGQDNFANTRAFYPRTSYFRGNAWSPGAKGSANLYDESSSFMLYDAFATYSPTFGKSNLSLTLGYSYQKSKNLINQIQIRGFSDMELANIDKIDDYSNWENEGNGYNRSRLDWNEINAAFFARANFNLKEKVFFNGSFRQEGSSKLSKNKQRGSFYSIGAATDLKSILNITAFDQFKLRLGYGVTGGVPGEAGLSQPSYRDIINIDGTITEVLVRDGNSDLTFEQNSEINLGLDLKTGRFTGSIEVYNRDITDMIFLLPQFVTVEGAGRRYENVGAINTRGIELTLGMDVIKGEKVAFNTGFVFSKYKSIVKDYYFDLDFIGNPGAPGQGSTTMIRIKKDAEFGEFWGVVYEGVDATGFPIFADVNNDGLLITGQDAAGAKDGDFSSLGNAIPDFELGWNNTISFFGWNVNAFFRGAFGHSLINTFRLFYESETFFPNNYNYINTELAEPGLTTSRFSSLFVEKASFFKLDNLVISKSISLEEIKGIRNVSISIAAQNLFVITKYTGSDPEPVLTDRGASTNGGFPYFQSQPTAFTPGIDRRNNYFPSRTISLGVKFDF